MLNLFKTLIIKDFLVINRNKNNIFISLFYVALILLIQGFSYAGDFNFSEIFIYLFTGAFWSSVALNSSISAIRLFSIETDSNALEYLMLYPVQSWIVFLSKFIGVFLSILISSLFAFILALFIFNVLDYIKINFILLFFTIILGILGLSITMTFYSSLIINLKLKEALLPILAFPLIIPIIISSTKLTVLCLENDYVYFYHWFNFLVVFDVMTFVVVCFFSKYTFDYS